ncbi:hypothetical protein [Nannocystis pusilla]|uniref:hypothetical protein n=1 Tax=Nannocystis pusilla TaxID=889268 RepID=UPI003DA50DE6
MRTLSLLLGGGALIGFAGGCFITNTAHCGYHENGAENPCPAGFVCNVCAAENNGCVPESEADSIDPQCRESGGTSGPTTEPGTVGPTGDPTTLPTSTDTTETTTDGTTIGVTTMGPTSTTETTTETTTDTSTTEAPETTIETMCDPADLDHPNCGEQYCVAENQCGWCTSLPEGKTCSDVDALTPACDEASGKCVECTPDEAQQCSGDTPVCDEASHTCVPCTEHAQCGTGRACDIFEGSCFPDTPNTVFFVQGSKTDCQAKTGLTADSPFCKLTDVPLDGAAKITIRLMASGTAPGGLAVPQDKVVAIIKETPSVPEINGQDIIGTPVSVNANARLYLSGIKLRFGQGSIVKCAGGSLWAHDSFWDGNGINAARAIDASACKVFVHRSRIIRCGAAMQLANSELRIENSFIIDNGALTAQHPAFNFLTNAKAHITYSTIARNQVVNSVSTFNCVGNGQDIVVRNSAVVGVAKLTNCNDIDPRLAFENGRFEEVADTAAVNNVMGQWFNAPIQDVYTPKNGGNVDPLEDMATWAEGDPLVDFTGMAAIPTDEPSFAGARQPL